MTPDAKDTVARLRAAGDHDAADMVMRLDVECSRLFNEVERLAGLVDDARYVLMNGAMRLTQDANLWLSRASGEREPAPAEVEVDDG